MKISNLFSRFPATATRLALIPLTVMAAGVAARSAHASTVPEYDQLNLGNSEPTRLTDDEAIELSRQGLENFDQQVEQSDPETKAAIRRAQRQFERNREASLNEAVSGESSPEESGT